MRPLRAAGSVKDQMTLAHYTIDPVSPTISARQDEARFEFGENWSRFLMLVNEPRIAEAERSLRDLLGLESLSGKSFLDIGCGSGLFSLAAMRLGAYVTSFDYDLQSVA